MFQNLFQSVGIDAYRKTWDTFFAYTKLGVFDIQELHIVADENVAFCFATMKCADKSNSTDYIDLDFRLTIGLKKLITSGQLFTTIALYQVSKGSTD